MILKVVFLSSAALLAVVPSTFAADAIVAAAPESIEHVSVCDAFGAGYFHIPGTGACLSIGGEIRHQVTWNSTDTGSKWSTSSGSLYRLDVNSKTDSELGTVYSFMRIEGLTNGTTSNFLYAGIGGFEAGHYESAWTRFFGYGGFTDDGGRYGLMTTSYAAYQGNAGPLTYFASVDDLQATAGKTFGMNAAVKSTFDDFSGGFGIAQDGAARSIALKGYIASEVNGVGLRLMGLYADKANNSYTQDIAGFTLLGAVKADLTDDLYVTVDYSYSFTPKTSFTVVDLGWHATEGFDVLASASHDSGTKAKTAYLRFFRTF